MKKLMAVVAPAAILASIVATDASDAQAEVPINPQIVRFFATTVHGTITVPAAPGAPLAGFNCGNMTIVATSKDTYTAPGAIFASPKWTRHAAATGNWGSGSCSYSLNVPGGSAFFLNASGQGSFGCDVIETWVGPTGAAVGPITVPFATSKVESFGISRVTCEVIK